MVEVDGHDVEALTFALSSKGCDPDKPTVVIANTIKGKGVSFMENQIKWHYLPVNSEQALKAKNEIKASYA